MADTGPCGPCSEIHVDCRSPFERAAFDGKGLVNNDHPQVIEIWNNVFMQFNRLKDGSLQTLPAQHVDTGMGLERLVRVLQGKSSNYDTDVFQPLIQFISAKANKVYGENEQTDIAMRVMADHIRAISFCIADGQLPSNNKAGYVIRRILRRAVRYAYTFLDFKEPFLNKLVPVLADQCNGAVVKHGNDNRAPWMMDDFALIRNFAFADRVDRYFDHTAAKNIFTGNHFGLFFMRRIHKTFLFPS
jgi:alanyl-tRNA synthetase